MKGEDYLRHIWLDSPKPGTAATQQGAIREMAVSLLKPETVHCFYSHWLFRENMNMSNHFGHHYTLQLQAYLYCSRSLGSTERTTGLWSTHSRKGVSSRVLYTSPTV